MAGDHDGLARLGPSGTWVGVGVAVGAGVGLVEQFHGPQVDLARLHHQIP